MKTHKIIKAYQTQYNNPIILSLGDVVKLGEEEAEEKWKGWILAETSNKKGWIPIQIIEFSNDRKAGIIKEDYSAKELDVEIGDEIVKIKSLNGWTWAKKVITREEGWVPDEIIE